MSTYSFDTVHTTSCALVCSTSLQITCRDCGERAARRSNRTRRCAQCHRTYNVQHALHIPKHLASPVALPSSLPLPALIAPDVLHALCRAAHVNTAAAPQPSISCSMHSALASLHTASQQTRNKHSLMLSHLPWRAISSSSHATSPTSLSNLYLSFTTNRLLQSQRGSTLTPAASTT